MEIKTIKDLKNWIIKAEAKFGTDDAKLNLFVQDNYSTCGIVTKIFKDDMTYNSDSNSINMRMYLSSTEKNEYTKITIKK